MKSITRLTLSVALILSIGGALATAQAAPEKTTWQKDHPRRVQVNHRLANQNKRIAHEVKDGQINKQQAHNLRANDKAIRGEERAMAKQDGSHLTKADQTALNQQLNKNSTQIGK